MAITNGDATRYLWRNAAVINTYPFALDGWAYTHTLANYWAMFVLTDGTTAEIRAQMFQTGADNTMQVNVRSTAAGGDPIGPSTAGTADTWQYYTGTFVSTTLREAYRNAGSRQATTNSVSPANSNRFIIGNFEDLGGGWDPAGALGELAVWNLGSMTQVQRESLWSKRYNGGSGGNGANPLAITAEVGQPWTGALVSYWRLTNTSDLNDLQGTNHLTMVGSLSNWGGTAPPVDAVPSSTTPKTYAASDDWANP